MPNPFPLAEGRKVVGDYAVYPNSLLFKAGEYSDKDFSVSAVELASAAAGFVPTGFNVEHSRHGAHQALDGAFGGILSAFVDPSDPETLRGEVALPLWLDERLKTKAPSLEFDRASKQINGAALTYTPRVSEAALMSAVAEFATSPAALQGLPGRTGNPGPTGVINFGVARHNTPEGQVIIQQAHDLFARGGAVCDRKNAEMSSQHEAMAIQKMHDETTKHGATCSKGDAPDWAKSMFSLIHPAELTPAQPKGPRTMSEKAPWYARLIGPLKTTGATEEDIHTAFSELPLPSASGMTDAERADFTALKQQNARLVADGIAAQAETFAASQVSAGRILPYEKSSLVAQFCRAAEDDASAPVTVKFSALEDGKPVEKTGGRLDALKAATLIRPAHGLTQELTGHGRALGEADYHALFSRDSAGETPEEKQSRQNKEVEAERKAQGLPAKA